MERGLTTGFRRSSQLLAELHGIIPAAVGNSECRKERKGSNKDNLICGVVEPWQDVSALEPLEILLALNSHIPASCQASIANAHPARLNTNLKEPRPTTCALQS